MAILQFYEKDNHARLFDVSRKVMIDISHPVRLGKVRINNILKKFCIKRSAWEKTDWGWQCKCILSERNHIYT